MRRFRENQKRESIIKKVPSKLKIYDSQWNVIGQIGPGESVNYNDLLLKKKAVIKL